jgi:aminoglycoside 6'-N-acetyltransferase
LSAGVRDHEGEAHADVPGDWLQITFARAGHGPAGDCALAPQTHEARTAEIGFTSLPSIRGRGYAREAASLLLRYLFGQLGQHRVTASYDPRNPPRSGCLRSWGYAATTGDWFLTSGRP